MDKCRKCGHEKDMFDKLKKTKDIFCMCPDNKDLLKEDSELLGNLVMAVLHLNDKLECKKCTK